MTKIISKQINNIQTQTLMLCCYCGYHYKDKKLMKCSSKYCNLKVCYNCAVFIMEKPFCPECIIKMMKEDTLFIITKKRV